MHNHKEVLCRIQDCERSFPGKGFPRKWNANDHMKRVHRYTPPEDSNSGDASSPSSSSVDMPYPVRSGHPAARRHARSPVDSSRSKKAKATSGRTTRGTVKASSCQQSSQCRGLAEQSRHLKRPHPEVFPASMDWLQWQQYQAFQGSDQDRFTVEKPL